MTDQQKKRLAAEDFVRKVLTEDLKQKVSKKTVKNVAIEVSKAIPLAVDAKLRKSA
jgi:hypothetical protein